jgi:DNA (cytosine-5)-methyltransferase 1
MKFVDLFAGLGGFHVSLTNLGNECVFACEKEDSLRKLYVQNFGVACAGDIKTIKGYSIPQHDILCAGFPCQPFSKAGKQKGLEDIGRGDLIHHIFRILRTNRPRYIILENVPNLRKHDREATWELIESTLRRIGYDVKEAILSPHDFGVPQIRKRIFIVGSYGRDSLKNFSFPSPINSNGLDIKNILDRNPTDAKKLSIKQLDCLSLWQQIIDIIPKSDNIPGGLPIWAMEFGATYPITGKAPYKLNSEELGKYKGAFGISLYGLKKSAQIALLPSYARYKENKFPLWKQKYLLGIREFLNRYSMESLPV